MRYVHKNLMILALTASFIIFYGVICSKPAIFVYLLRKTHKVYRDFLRVFINAAQHLQLFTNALGRAKTLFPGF